MEPRDTTSVDQQRVGRAGSKRRWAIGLAVVAAAAMTLLVVPLIASAKSDPVDDSIDIASAADVRDCDAIATAGEFPRLSGFLAGLVADGVISQEQSDEIDARVRDQASYRCTLHSLFPKREAIGSTADATGATRRQVRRSLIGGGTLAGFASDHGVDEATLTAAMMAAPSERAAVKVANGELAQTEANDLLSEIQDYIGELIHAEGLRGFLETRW